ncbi:MAG: hypothetical protein M3326_03615, partial [Actinomycetota bacterium]|nr:hypothetical protein [Actinomycetota bacterium]
MQRLSSWWSGLDRAYRFNVGLYAMAAVALAALLFEVVTGGDTSPKQQVAAQAPVTTVRPTTTALATTSAPS